MKISVVTPVYNREDCILKCLESVASENAGGRRIEHVIADDGSTDRSASIVASFAASHPDVKLVRLDKNSGPNTARNAAIAAATGDYVLFIDSDDCLASGSIEKIEAVMNSDPGYDQYLFSCSHNRENVSAYGDRYIFTYTDFLLGKVFLDFAHVIKRETLLEFPFDESLRIHEYLFHLRFYRKAGRILFNDITVSLVDTGRDDHVTVTTRKTTDRALKESRIYTELFINWFGKDLQASDEGRSRLASLLADKYRFAVLAGDYRTAKRAKEEGACSPILYKIAEKTGTGPLCWNAIKLAMRAKWFFHDKTRKR